MTRAIEQLQDEFLTPEQVRASHKVMGLDTQLIDRRHLFRDRGWTGGSSAAAGGAGAQRSMAATTASSLGNPRLDPATDAAKIRAMYTDPDFTRRGVGRMVLGLVRGGGAQRRFRAGRNDGHNVRRAALSHLRLCSAGAAVLSIDRWRPSAVAAHGKAIVALGVPGRCGEIEVGTEPKRRTCGGDRRRSVRRVDRASPAKSGTSGHPDRCLRPGAQPRVVGRGIAADPRRLRQDAIYTRMAWDSLPQWKALSEVSGLPIFIECGVLFFSQVEDDYFARQHRRPPRARFADRGDGPRRAGSSASR